MNTINVLGYGRERDYLNVKVQTNTEAAIKQIMELNTQIEREKNLQKEYNQWLKEGTVSWEEYNREMEHFKTTCYRIFYKDTSS